MPFSKRDRVETLTSTFGTDHAASTARRKMRVHELLLRVVFKAACALRDDDSNMRWNGPLDDRVFRLKEKGFQNTDKFV